MPSPTATTRPTRARTLPLALLLAALTLTPAAIAPAPTLTPGQITLQDAGASGDYSNFTNAYTQHLTLAGDYAIVATNGSTRWTLQPTGLETGGVNYGSDWNLSRYNDAGGWVGPTIYANRSSGAVGLGTSTSLNGLLNLASGTDAAHGIYWGTDTDVYRCGVSLLCTDGKFGIGITPAQPLHVYKSGATALIRLDKDATVSYLGNDGTYAFLGSASGATGIKARIDLSAPDNSLTLASNGGVIIGAPSTSANFGLFNVAADGNALQYISSAGTGITSNVYLQSSRGTHAAPTDSVNGDQVGAVVARAYSSGRFDTALISFNVDGTFTTGQRPPSRIDVYTNAANGAQALAGSWKSDQRLYLSALTGTPSSFPANNYLTFYKIDDTHVGIAMKGSDGTVRTGSITVS